MFERYLKFAINNNSSLLDKTQPLKSDLAIRFDDNGMSSFGEIGENTPKVVADLFNKIKEMQEKVKNDGTLNKLTEDDLDEIINNIFSGELGEPDETFEEEINGKVYERKFWNVEGGRLARVSIKPTSEELIKKMDKDSVEYFEVKLKEAITNEDYLLAAEYRDRINEKINSLNN